MNSYRYSKNLLKNSFIVFELNSIMSNIGLLFYIIVMVKDKKNFNWLEEDSSDDVIKVYDSNWNELQNGDTIMAIKDLPVKGWQNIKRWDKFKNIKLTDESWIVESGNMVLKTEFFKKV